MIYALGFYSVLVTVVSKIFSIGPSFFVAFIVYVVYLCSGHAPRILESGTAKIVRGIKHALWRRKLSSPGFNYDEIVPGLFLGRMPNNEGDLQELKSKNVKSIIILNEEWELQVPFKRLNELGFDYIHLPCPDYFSPTVDEIQQSVDYIKQNIAKGNNVYCHCYAGKGRSAIVIIAYVAYINGWPVRKAFDFVKSKRSLVTNLPAMGGMRAQWKPLVRWEKLHNTKN
eukprot:TRINITY_DN3356_c0_g1_i2.p1 TRINITY_DN3356_c0_g1~~TRINITY_DN3356_c0_g1_i2.p1  ORF type:complete len:227 (-),score=43.28 TRINITY_DN3356_c0_g1_i2:57-737(-)